MLTTKALVVVELRCGPQLVRRSFSVGVRSPSIALSLASTRRRVGIHCALELVLVGLDRSQLRSVKLCFCCRKYGKKQNYEKN